MKLRLLLPLALMGCASSLDDPINALRPTFDALAPSQNALDIKGPNVTVLVNDVVAFTTDLNEVAEDSTCPISEDLIDTLEQAVEGTEPKELPEGTFVGPEGDETLGITFLFSDEGGVGRATVATSAEDVLRAGSGFAEFPVIGEDGKQETQLFWESPTDGPQQTLRSFSTNVAPLDVVTFKVTAIDGLGNSTTATIPVARFAAVCQ